MALSISPALEMMQLEQYAHRHSSSQPRMLFKRFLPCALIQRAVARGPGRRASVARGSPVLQLGDAIGVAIHFQEAVDAFQNLGFIIGFSRKKWPIRSGKQPGQRQPAVIGKHGIEWHDKYRPRGLSEYCADEPGYIPGFAQPSI